MEPGALFVEKWTKEMQPSYAVGAFLGYVYVPKGTRVFAGHVGAAGGGPVRDGAGKLVGRVKGPGYFKPDVAPGENDEVWKLDGWGGSPMLMTVPPVIARAPEELLVPAELVKQ